MRLRITRSTNKLNRKLGHKRLHLQLDSGLTTLILVADQTRLQETARLWQRALADEGIAALLVKE